MTTSTFLEKIRSRNPRRANAELLDDTFTPGGCAKASVIASVMRPHGWRFPVNVPPPNPPKSTVPLSESLDSIAPV